MRYDQPALGRVLRHPLLPSDVEGAIFFVRDRAWGFVATGREDHPGLCIRFDPESRYAVFLKGTDAGNLRHRANAVLWPSESNGLVKPTAFELLPRRIPRRLVSLMYWSPRRVGRVEPEEGARIKLEMSRLFGRGEPAWQR